MQLQGDATISVLEESSNNSIAVLPATGPFRTCFIALSKLDFDYTSRIHTIYCTCLKHTRRKDGFCLGFSFMTGLPSHLGCVGYYAGMCTTCETSVPEADIRLILLPHCSLLNY